MAAGGVLGDRLGPIPVLNVQGAGYVAGGLLMLWLLGSGGARRVAETVHDVAV